MKRFILVVLALLVLTACSRKDEPADVNQDQGIENKDEITPTVTPEVTKSIGDPGLLIAFIMRLENLNPKAYANYDILTEPLSTAQSMVDNNNSTQEEINAMIDNLRQLEKELNDGSNLPPVITLTESPDLTDPFTFLNGDPVLTKEDWEKRADEISRMYAYYMYGPMPDKTKEEVSYRAAGKTITISVKANGREISFPAELSTPNSSKVPMPEGGYPVILAFGWFPETNYANERGYAVITVNTGLIASDDARRIGVFYQLYPYGEFWTEQTGALMAWSWSLSKVIDVLETGAGEELGINPSLTIVTGVSRWGKAAAVAGAFDKRIKVTMPACSGAGGMAAFRYPTEGKVYDYSSIGASSTYKMTANEPLSSLQSSSEGHWFNNNFLLFRNVNYMPFDQHLLAGLMAEEGRHLFITASYLYEDWTNPPAMWMTYLAAQKIYDYVDLSDNLAIHIHKEGHTVTNGDMVYLLDYCDYHFYGKESASNLDDLKTSLYTLPQNSDPAFEAYMK